MISLMPILPGLLRGGYSDLLEMVKARAKLIIYMDLSIASCIRNAKSRPWEPHKYPSKQAQDENLAMLLEWIGQYGERDDTFCKQAHQALWQSFTAKKQIIKSNEEARAYIKKFSSEL